MARHTWDPRDGLAVDFPRLGVMAAWLDGLRASLARSAGEERSIVLSTACVRRDDQLPEGVMVDVRFARHSYDFAAPIAGVAIVGGLPGYAVRHGREALAAAIAEVQARAASVAAADANHHTAHRIAFEQEAI